MPNASLSPRPLDEVDLRALHDELLGVHGPQGWWPARTPFEMMIGAVLVQNTNWRNVEVSLGRLREAGLLEPEALVEHDADALVELIRPSGFMTAKSRACRGLARWFLDTGLDLGAVTTAEARLSLLACLGVGPESADVILLYVYERGVFVADAYARRLLDARGCAVPRTYEQTRRALEGALRRSGLTAAELGELHALIVAEGQRVRREG